MNIKKNNKLMGFIRNVMRTCRVSKNIMRGGWKKKIRVTDPLSEMEVRIKKRMFIAFNNGLFEVDKLL